METVTHRLSFCTPAQVHKVLLDTNVADFDKLEHSCWQQLSSARNAVVRHIGYLSPAPKALASFPPGVYCKVHNIGAAICSLNLNTYLKTGDTD